MTEERDTPAPGAPTFRDLERAEVDALLARNHVARLAFTFRNHVDIEPIHYIYSDGWLYGRTSVGTKLVVLAHQPWVAVEVDEIEGLFDWRSVVVHGAFYVLDPYGTSADREAYMQALALLRTLVPAALTPDDPTVFRAVLFRISIDAVRGRAATSEPA